MAGVALLASGCASAPPHRGAQRHAAGSASVRRPVTKPEVLDTTSSTSTTTTSTAIAKATTTVPQPDHVVPPPPPTTTRTTDPPPPQCDWANFSTAVSTDEASYPQGQTVHITLTFRNDGPSCAVYGTGYGCPRIDIDNGAGQPTWTSVSQPTTGCAETVTPNNPTVLPSGWSQSFAFDWTQMDCSTRTEGNFGTCSGPQVAPGQYQVIGTDSGGTSDIPPSVPAVVTIT